MNNTTPLIFSNIFDVKKIYKGHNIINYGKIQFVGHSSMYSSPNGNVIIFCKINSDKTLRPCYDINTIDNTVLLSPYFSFGLLSSGNGYMRGGDFLFKSIHKCRNYLKKYPDIKIKEDPEEQLLYRIAKEIRGEKVDTAAQNRNNY